MTLNDTNFIPQNNGQLFCSPHFMWQMMQKSAFLQVQILPQILKLEPRGGTCTKCFQAVDLYHFGIDRKAEYLSFMFAVHIGNFGQQSQIIFQKVAHKFNCLETEFAFRFLRECLQFMSKNPIQAVIRWYIAFLRVKIMKFNSQTDKRCSPFIWIANS